MSYSKAVSLRDREFEKFMEERAAYNGSQTVTAIRPFGTVKVYSFTNAELTSNVSGGGTFDSYTEWPINGRLQSITWRAGTTEATGSLIVTESGTGLGVYTMISGTVVAHHLKSTTTVYPRASTVSTVDVSLSGTNTSEYAEMAFDSIIRVVGSGIGSSTASGVTGYSLSGLDLVYI